MKKNGWIWLITFAAGLVILLFPDNTEPLFCLNNLHGPSIIDLIGLGLMLTGWLMSAVLVIKHYRIIVQRVGKNTSILLLLLYFLSLAGIISALKLSSEWILWTSIIVAASINSLFIIFSIRLGSANKEV